MNLHTIRRRLAIQIIVFNFVSIIILVLLYLLKGFDFDEFSSTITLLTSVTAIYVGVLFQFIGKQIRNTDDDEDITRGIPYINILKWVVPAHFGLILFILVLKSIPVISFREMNLFLLLVESTFGGYMGHIMSALFGIEQQVAA